jgi:general stress protein 26
MEQARPEQLLEAARITMEASAYCFLITSGAAEADARLMQPFVPDEDLTIRLGTSMRSRKVREIRDDDRVVLAYSDPTEVAYVVLKGTVALERDLDQKRRFWREEWRAFYPEGPEGEDYVLVRFVPDRVELMNFTREVTPPPYGLRPAVVERAGATWRLAEEQE